MRTKLVIAGKSKAEIVAATASALDKKELPGLEPGAMCYMLVEAAVLKRPRHAKSALRAGSSIAGVAVATAGGSLQPREAGSDGLWR
jgi:hypothetical protein